MLTIIAFIFNCNTLIDSFSTQNFFLSNKITTNLNREKKSNNNDEQRNNSYNPKIKRIWQQSQPDLFVKELENIVDTVNNNVTIENGSLKVLFETHIPQIDSRLLSSTIYYIGNLKHRKQVNIKKEEINKLIFNIPRISNTLNIIEYCNLLSGLARLDITWSELIIIDNNILKKLPIFINKMNERNLGDLLWSLASMNASWNSFPSYLKNNILDHIETLINGFDSYTLSSIVWALAKIGCKWNEISYLTRKIMLSQLSNYHNILSSQQSSKVLWSLGTLGCDYKEF